MKYLKKFNKKEIDNHILEYIGESVFVIEDYLFGELNEIQKRVKMEPISKCDYNESIDRLIKSMRILKYTTGIDDELTVYDGSPNTNSVDDLLIPSYDYEFLWRDDYNKDLYDLNRVFNFIIINKQSSDKDIFEMFNKNPYDEFFIVTDKLEIYLNFLVEKKCIKREDLGWIKMYTPLEFSNEAFSEFKEITKNLCEKEIQRDYERKNPGWVKKHLIPVLFVLFLILAFVIYIYSQAYYPFLLPILIFLIILFSKREHRYWR